MTLTAGQTMIMILVIALGTMITRFTAFVLFPETKNPPSIITYLGSVLPPAMMGLLVVYCLKDVSVTHSPFGIPEAIAIVFLVLIHKWKGNVLLSIGGATVFYMLLVQFIF
ncbi:MAG: branched-chain amino acid transporter AzlD [Clostridia bacterium]|nr:branched-chain amino acid transporter AzlD [Clostridia bacterium]